MIDTSMFDTSMIFKITAAGLTVGLLNQLLIQAGKKEIAMMLDSTIGICGFVFFVKLLGVGLEAVIDLLRIF